MMMRPMGNVVMSPQPGMMRMQGPRFGNRVYNPAAGQMLVRPSYGQQPVKKYLRQKLSTKYVKTTIAEPIGISNISEEALLYVADELQFRLRTMIQTASKHTRHSSTNKFSPHHFNSAIKFHFGKRAHNYIKS